MAKRLSESVLKQRFTVISTKLKDRCFLLESGNYTFVKEVRDDDRFAISMKYLQNQAVWR